MPRPIHTPPASDLGLSSESGLSSDERLPCGVLFGLTTTKSGRIRIKSIGELRRSTSIAILSFQLDRSASQPPTCSQECVLP